MERERDGHDAHGQDGVTRSDRGPAAAQGDFFAAAFALASALLWVTIWSR
jgi:hypothetical protein